MFYVFMDFYTMSFKLCRFDVTPHDFLIRRINVEKWLVSFINEDFIVR